MLSFHEATLRTEGAEGGKVPIGCLLKGCKVNLGNKKQASVLRARTNGEAEIEAVRGVSKSPSDG